VVVTTDALERFRRAIFGGQALGDVFQAHKRGVCVAEFLSTQASHLSRGHGTRGKCSFTTRVLRLKRQQMSVNAALQVVRVRV
jgi:hypothetical protein